jgi:hypothetical protein
MDVCTRRQMTVTPLELLDTSIAQLQTLVAFLDDQLGWTESATLETRACKEIARSLCVLIRTHRAPRYESCASEQRGDLHWDRGRHADADVEYWDGS